MKNDSIKNIFIKISDDFKKYNLTIFIVVLVGGLSTAVILLSDILQISRDASSTQQSSDNITFDQQTIDRVNQLTTSDESSGDYVKPQGRINPFAE